MCGIAGIVDLEGERAISPSLLERMGRALFHRGPDEEGYLSRPGLGLVSRRLSIVGLADGRQPIFNEDESVAVVYNGELFDYPEQKAQLEKKGHRFRTHCDTEILVHLWEEYGLDFFAHLKGQFAFALLDFERHQLVLARDRTGICPLYWTRRDQHLLFASEIKALLAAGVEARLDPLALDHLFSFFAMGTRRTMFDGVESLPPGSFLVLDLPRGANPAHFTVKRYWDFDFPPRGEEDQRPLSQLEPELDHLLRQAVAKRLRADVPVVSYLSGGVDSTTVASLASQQLGRPIPTFTIRIQHPRLDETERARLAARTIGTEPAEILCGEREIAQGYRDLVIASECPVIDTSSAAIYQLATRVREDGFKVALTGEGADEALAGYPWFKVHRCLSVLDRLGLADRWRKRVFGRFSRFGWERYQRRYQAMGGYHATSDLYAACSLSGDSLYTPETLERMEGRVAADDLELDTQRMASWDPLNRSLYLGYKVMLNGLLMTHKGDRPAMANSVETRFPFLDEDVVAFCARLSPAYKLKGLRQDKHLLRKVAAKFLPNQIAARPKSIFRARYSGSFLEPEPPFVAQLLSRESLDKTGYFKTDRVLFVRDFLKRYPSRLPPHMGREVAFVGALSTQLWHHLFLGGGLCELEPWRPPNS